MATQSPPLTAMQSPREKLLVVRFLNAHLAQRAIDGQSCGMLYRMITMMSAMGREIHSIVHSKTTHVRTLQSVEWYAACVAEGCEVIHRHLAQQGQLAHKAAIALPELANWEDEILEMHLSTWRALLQTLKPPTRNDTRLFKHLTTHYDDAVYHGFLQLHRKKPDSAIWVLEPKLTAIQQTLEEIVELCSVAGALAEQLSGEYEAAVERVKRQARRKLQPIIVPTEATARAHYSDDASDDILNRGAYTSPIPDTPPRLPPLPFEGEGTDDPQDNLDHSAVRVGDIRKRPVVNQSFSAVEDRVGRRDHCRSATMASVGYVAEPAGIGLGISQRHARPIFRGPAVGARRRGSSQVPRIFTGSFSELESNVHRLRLHKVKTPEAPPSSPVEGASSVAHDPVWTCGLADELSTSGICPSPVPLLQRREALVSRDTQWESREVKGEVVRSRRPSERLQLQRAQTIADPDTGGLERWLTHASQMDAASPTHPDSAVKRGLMRHRENTL